MELDLNSKFCLQLANKVILEKIDEGSNAVLSPLSIQLMLNLVAVGSAGKTLEQMLYHLGSESVDHLNLLSSNIVDSIETNNSPNASPLLYVANRLWVQESLGIKASFQRIAQKFYKAKAKEVDFAKGDEVVNAVNSWVEDATEGLIRNLLPSGSLTSDTLLVFTNAIYFNGKWDRFFDEARNSHRDFHLLNGQVISVPFMTGLPFQKHLYKFFDGYKILNIPYQSNQEKTRFSMYFFLPSDINGLQNLLQRINSDPGFLNQNFKLQEVFLDPYFWIPKFKFSSEFEAKKTLVSMGMDYPFLPRREFYEMVDAPIGHKMFLSEMFHKSYIEVNEKGTEAAASTAPIFIQQQAKSNPPSFVADHPFFFMVREENLGIVLFVGAVLNPLLVD